MNGLLNVACMVVSLKATYDALVLRLDVCGEIGCKILDMNVLKVIRNDMSREVILK